MVFSSSIPIPADPAIVERVQRLELPFDRYGIDPYGIEQRELAKFFTVLGWAYHRYFGMRTLGACNIPVRGRAMLVGNHAGGWALDAAMVVASAFFEREPPRLAQGMAEKFISRFPFMSMFSSKVGQFTGLPHNAQRLLNDDRLLMVFPEGARGTAKLYFQRDSLVRFGTGFVRLALATKAPVVPFAFVGGGEAVPTIANLTRVGKALGLPYVPITPYGLPLPLPVPLVLLYGEPIRLEGSGGEADHVIMGHVDHVKAKIGELLHRARAIRDGKERPGAEQP